MNYASAFPIAPVDADAALNSHLTMDGTTEPQKASEIFKGAFLATIALYNKGGYCNPIASPSAVKIDTRAWDEIHWEAWWYGNLCAQMWLETRAMTEHARRKVATP